MLKTDLMMFVINNGYQYSENQNILYIDKIIDELGNIESFLEFNKDTKEICLSFLKENVGSYKSVELDEFRLKVIMMINQIFIEESEDKQ